MRWLIDGDVYVLALTALYFISFTLGKLPRWKTTLFVRYHSTNLKCNF